MKICQSWNDLSHKMVCSILGNINVSSMAIPPENGERNHCIKRQVVLADSVHSMLFHKTIPFFFKDTLQLSVLKGPPPSLMCVTLDVWSTLEPLL